jgi:mono/diheme cytochrome c family protein
MRLPVWIWICAASLATVLQAQEQVQILPPLPPEEVLAAFVPDNGRSETAASCGLCHAPVMITGKHYTADKWAETVDHMVDKGAKVSDADYDTIINYLSRNYGPEKLAVTSPAAGAASGSAPR